MKTRGAAKAAGRCVTQTNVTPRSRAASLESIYQITRRRSRWQVNCLLAFCWLVLAGQAAALGADNQPPPGFVALFNGRDFSGWKVPEGDHGHWKVRDGVIDYDAESEAPGDNSLWT